VHPDNLLVLFFYPKDSTPGCTAESIDFSTLKGKFQTLNCSVIGVSKDSVKSHLKFIDKSNLSVELISDSDGALCDMFGVMKMKNMYGKKYLGIERSTFLIGLDGKIVKEWRKVKVPGHATEVYDFVAKLSES
jgi:peroxiredoxin Q/BCP